MGDQLVLLHLQGRRGRTLATLQGTGWAEGCSWRIFVCTGRTQMVQICTSSKWPAFNWLRQRGRALRPASASLPNLEGGSPTGTAPSAGRAECIQDAVSCCSRCLVGVNSLYCCRCLAASKPRLCMCWMALSAGRRSPMQHCSQSIAKGLNACPLLQCNLDIGASRTCCYRLQPGGICNFIHVGSILGRLADKVTSFIVARNSAEHMLQGASFECVQNGMPCFGDPSHKAGSILEFYQSGHCNSA